MDFTINSLIFQTLRQGNNSTPYYIDDNILKEQIRLINKSELFKSLLEKFENDNMELQYDPTANSAVYSSGIITIKDITVNNVARLLSHELGHAYEDIQGTLEANPNASEFERVVINYEQNEAEATAISFIIRQQILNSGGPDISISNRIGGFTPAGEKTDRDAGVLAVVNKLQEKFGSRVTTSMTNADFLPLVQDIVQYIWGTSLLTMPGKNQRWATKRNELNKVYTDDGKEVPIFLQDSERIFQSATIVNGQHQFIFKDKDDKYRVWVYEGTNGSDLSNKVQDPFAGTEFQLDNRDLVTGKEKAGSNDTLHGGDGDDFLYGGWTNDDSGNDALYGDDGNDTLVGGFGQDTLDGGTGDDTFYVQGTDTAYDKFIGGEGIDKILGSAGNDVIRVHELLAADSIEVIDGGGGVDRIEGTDLGDWIDLSGTVLTNISGVWGGKGNDTLIGTAQGDYLYGGDNQDILDGRGGNDVLDGGAGTDIYIIEEGSHDTIIDSGMNYILYRDSTGKEDLIAGVFLAVGTGGSNFESFEKKADGTPKYTLEFHSPGVLTINGTTSITFANQTSAADFADGAFGITLKAAPQSIIINGTGYRDEMGIFQLGPAVTDWQLECSSYINYSIQRPFFTTFLLSTAPSLTAFGGDEADFLFGFLKKDMLYGGSGNDIITGALLKYNNVDIPYSEIIEGDFISGDSGNDLLTGSGGDDGIYGGDDNDYLDALDGKDFLDGGSGNDVLAGGGGDDILNGGDNDDILVGDGYLEHESATIGNFGLWAWSFISDAAGFYTGWEAKQFIIRPNLPSFELEGNDNLFGGRGDLAHS